MTFRKRPQVAESPCSWAEAVPFLPLMARCWRRHWQSRWRQPSGPRWWWRRRQRRRRRRKPCAAASWPARRHRSQPGGAAPTARPASAATASVAVPTLEFAAAAAFPAVPAAAAGWSCAAATAPCRAVPAGRRPAWCTSESLTRPPDPPAGRFRRDSRVTLEALGLSACPGAD
jgi:hypothetical protein